jgi:choline dehydrogenase-like flavoprotein
LAVSSFKIAQNIATEFGSVLLSPPPADFADDNILLNDAKNNPFIVVSDHISGTTRMGRTLQDGVVDGKLHVFGVKNLMIADLGVAPVTPNANPCYDVYLIALTAASILEE